MCIVIDVNVIPSVFNLKASDHHAFRPILDCLDNRDIKMVYGGTRYNKELGKMRNYHPILLEYKRRGKVHEVDKDRVDKVQDIIQRITSHKDFNDQAIVAIVIVSRCRLICSKDKKSFPFLRLPKLYPKGIKRPSIYSGQQNVGLLRDRHIRGQCGPCSVC